MDATDDNQNFLLMLLTAAMQCSNKEYRVAIKDAADLLHHSLIGLHGDPTRGNMRVLNSAWSNAERVLANVPAEADPLPPLSGSTEPARLAA